MKILLNGYCGRTAKEVIRLAERNYNGEEYEIFGVDGFCEKETERLKKSFAGAEKEADCLIDFSYHTLIKELIDFAAENRLPAVIATTGHTDAEKKIIEKASEKIPIFYSSNFSVGIALLTEFVKKTVTVLPDADVEITEIHHRNKVDAPSGTALFLAEELKKIRKDAIFKFGRKGEERRDKNEIGIHSLRIGNAVGEHEIVIGYGGETINLKHRAADRSVFAEGALKAAKFLVTKKAGMYSMKDMLNITGERI